MKRIYCLLPNIDTTRQVVNELLLARIDDKHIHVLAREGTPMDDLPEANLLQKSDFVHGVEQGLAVGGATGVIAGLIAVTFPPAGLVLGGGAVLGIAIAGAGIGAWVSGMIGTDVPNTQLKEFEQEVANGAILLMIDSPASRVKEINELINLHHPEADMHGTDPAIPAFP